MVIKYSKIMAGIPITIDKIKNPPQFSCSAINPENEPNMVRLKDANANNREYWVALKALLHRLLK